MARFNKKRPTLENSSSSKEDSNTNSEANIQVVTTGNTPENPINQSNKINKQVQNSSCFAKSFKCPFP
jgi:hypothetical protein